MAFILQSPNNIFGTYFTKPNIILALILQSPNVILALILQSPNVIFGTYFTKPKYYFWQLLMKPNNTLAPIYKSPNIILAKTITLCSKVQNYFLTKTYLHILMSLTHGKYTLLISQKIFLLQNLWELYLFFFHNQLTTKAHVFYPWQDYSSCRDGQAQRSLTTRRSWASPTHMKIPAAEAHVSYPVKFQYNLIAGTNHH